MEYSPFYCGYCRCDPCSCDGHGNYTVSEKELKQRLDQWLKWYQEQK